jgi:hypothetical protein
LLIKPTFFTKRSLRVALYDEIVWNLNILLNPKTLRCFGHLRGNLRIAVYEQAKAAHPELFGQLADQNAISAVCDCAVGLSEVSPADQPEQVRLASQFLEAVRNHKLDRRLLVRDSPPQVHEYIQSLDR